MKTTKNMKQSKQYQRAHKQNMQKRKEKDGNQKISLLFWSDWLEEIEGHVVI